MVRALLLVDPGLWRIVGQEHLDYAIREASDVIQAGVGMRDWAVYCPFGGTAVQLILHRYFPSGPSDVLWEITYMIVAPESCEEEEEEEEEESPPWKRRRRQ